MSNEIKTIEIDNFTIRKFDDGSYDLLIKNPKLRYGNAATLKYMLGFLLREFERNLKYPITSEDEIIVVSTSDETEDSSTRKE